METNLYAVFGLDPDCTTGEIRSAYRQLAKQYHPDVNQRFGNATDRTQELNLAYAVLGNPVKRRLYDERRMRHLPERGRITGRTGQKITRDVRVRLDELLRGTRLEVEIRDGGDPTQPEVYSVNIPPETPPNSRVQVAREQHPDGGVLELRVKTQPGGFFKVKGSDLRCDLRVPEQLAAIGGVQSVRGAAGRPLQLTIPAGTRRGDIIRIDGEGLPRIRGGRGALLVRIVFRPEIQIRRRPRV